MLDLLTRPTVAGGRSAAGSSGDRARRCGSWITAAAVAYTLPGWHSRVVLSAGLVDLLTEQELAAVIEHERAHLRARHDLLVLPFQAWAVALGRIPGVRLAGGSVAELTEMLADDVAAARTHGRHWPRHWPRWRCPGRPPAVPPNRLADSPAITGTAVADRVRRLLDPQPTGRSRWRCGRSLVGRALLAIPASVLLLHWT